MALALKSGWPLADESVYMSRWFGSNVTHQRISLLKKKAMAAVK
jgi:hypothetical protein